MDDMDDKDDKDDKDDAAKWEKAAELFKDPEMRRAAFWLTWQSDWMDLAMKAATGGYGTYEWNYYDSIIRARQAKVTEEAARAAREAAEASERTARATFWMAWMTGALAVATVLALLAG